jgi:hypothetical protein
MSTSFELKPTEQLSAIYKESRARPNKETKGRRVYLCEDRVEKQLFLSQKLPALMHTLNRTTHATPDQRVSLTGLWLNCDSEVRGRNGGYLKHRFRVTSVPFDDALQALEAARLRGYDRVVVAGSPACYRWLRQPEPQPCTSG